MAFYSTPKTHAAFYDMYRLYNQYIKCLNYFVSPCQVCFWLLDNGYRVLIAVCDTFRSGALEQLRTYTAHLSSLHSHGNSLPNVQLLERGYNKDAAGIAMEAIHYGKIVWLL